jgi:hypothetical protein
MRAAQLFTAGVALALAIPAPIVGQETISLQRRRWRRTAISRR